jgi:hypothetical protein
MASLNQSQQLKKSPKKSTAPVKVVVDNDVIVSPDVFTHKEVRLAVPKKKSDGKIFTSSSYKKNPIYLETPWLQATMGVTNNIKFIKSATDKLKWQLILSATPADESEAGLVEHFFNELRATDEMGIEYQFTNAKGLYNKEKSKESIKENAWKLFKQSRPEYPAQVSPTIYSYRTKEGKDKVVEDPNRPGIQVYIDGDELDSEGNPIDRCPETFEKLQELIPKGSFIKAILSVRFASSPKDGGFLCSVSQLLVKPRANNRPKNYAFGKKQSAQNESVDSGEKTLPESTDPTTDGPESTDPTTDGPEEVEVSTEEGVQDSD